MNQSNNQLRLLAFGDVVGRIGRTALAQQLPGIRQAYSADLCIVNAENAAGGLGIDANSAEEIRAAGADVITLGDHTWHKKEFRQFLDQNSSWCIRPANYPQGAAGRGWTIHKTSSGQEIAIMNVIGRVFMNGALDCPFRAVDRILSTEIAACKMRVCDLHAEATSEKIAMGRYLDGRCSLLFGTHTHVQTADEQVLSGGTGYLSDLGMCGSIDGVIGMDSDVALGRFLTGLPHAYKLAPGRPRLQGLFCEIDCESGKALKIQRIQSELLASL